MKKLLLFLLFTSLYHAAFTQANLWSKQSFDPALIKDQSVNRLSFPKNFVLFKLKIDPFRQSLFSIIDKKQPSSLIISLPNSNGELERFEINEASNFDEQLQKQFPEIRAFSGRGLTDATATLKLSLSPQGIDATIFRIGSDDDFIVAYSADHLIYAVYKSEADRRKLPWNCTTPDEKMTAALDDLAGKNGTTARSGYNLKTMRLAQSVTAEYSNYFGATSAAQVNLVLTAVNNTLSRCNGVYEKDLALHLNLVAASTNVFYYNAATDPYSAAAAGAAGAWNAQLMNTLHNVLGDAAFDIGHLFGASGGGGNAGCIGCICSNDMTTDANGQPLNYKGSGFTSPADGVPKGDNFDIDYVVHEVGHQLGANHTFSFSNEGTGVNVEVGSGITIMGYAGITSQDVAAHSIDIYHARSIDQIQANLNARTCPVTTTLSTSNLTLNAVPNYTIPISTPFALTAAATSGTASDVITYCWEEIDNASAAQTGGNSIASPTKASGPNWISFAATTSGTRFFPRLATILAGGTTTGPLTGGDAGITTEALSSVSRALNFRVTARNNAPYHPTAPVRVGQTQFTNSVVTVTNSSGPFVVTAPNTAVTWNGGTPQTVTWNVAGTTTAPVSCANVSISLSTDGGQTFPTILVASTPNDGSEGVTLPDLNTTTARIKVAAVGNIFFDISNTNFTICTIPPLTGTYSTNCCTKTLYTVNQSIPVGNVYVQYQWPGVSNVSAALYPGSPSGTGFYAFSGGFSFNIASQQQISVYITGTNSCGAVDATRTFIQSSFFTIAASPNPAKNFIKVKIIEPSGYGKASPLAVNGKTNISMYDSHTGILVQQWSFSEVKATDYNLKLFSTKTGTYDLRVERNGVSAGTKIIVEPK